METRRQSLERKRWRVLTLYRLDWRTDHCSQMSHVWSTNMVT